MQVCQILPRLEHINLEDPSSWVGQTTYGDLGFSAGRPKAAETLLRELEFLLGQAANDAASADTREITPSLRGKIQSIPKALESVMGFVQKRALNLEIEHPKTKIDLRLSSSIQVLFDPEMRTELARLAADKSSGDKSRAFKALQEYLNQIKNLVITRIQNRESV